MLLGFLRENCEGNADPESLSDIDDAEADGYLHNEEETQYKKIIWEEMNKEYLEEQAAKEALAAELAATGIDPEAGKKHSCQPKLLDEKQTTIYKRVVHKNYNLKMKASRALEEKRARLGLVECMNHELLQLYPGLHEKPGRDYTVSTMSKLSSM
ncbi:transcription factor IIIB 90 kDa subunit isoform X1 [Zea mays]|uniref:transcription factor IIIB 90 kDa subunit isoform X1 n=1 Tax=Zea mays TaxID=4577 RepID=UPI0009A9D31A|nr:transcription factor IIIB 90 kDa subunit isoform X1 [Zea mays]|eukprot:XP_008652888.2 transcription factor IIIB 90 kDa subunit isoform X1 [Zea mays]